MKLQIHTEGFELTDAIRSYAESCAWEACEGLREETRVDAYLKKEGHDAFSCTLKAKLWRKTLVVKESGPDLYTLISEASRGLSRNLIKEKERRKTLLHRRTNELKGLKLEFV